MKKFGFTLAEVLITMTIIGVVAALTTPALFNNAHNAQVGPTLAKIKATIENANEQLMQEQEIGRISTLWNGVTNGADARDIYINMLRSQMRLENNEDANPPALYDYNGGEITVQFKILHNSNGVGDFRVAFAPNNLNRRFNINTVEGVRLAFRSPYVIPAGNNGIIDTNDLTNSIYIFVDINGIREPNRFGKDVFMFVLNDDGTLRPYGDFDVNGDYGDYSWQNLCNPDMEPPVANDRYAGLACTATIFNNGLRVTYDE